MASAKPVDIFKRLENEIRMSTQKLGIYTIIFLVLFGVFVYCIVNVVDLIQFYYSQKKSFQQLTVSRKKTNNPANPADDNEVYLTTSDKMNAENNDEYKRYTDQINKSIAEFKDYNEKLKAFYKDNKPDESPKDIIDQSIITKDKDNY